MSHDVDAIYFLKVFFHNVFMFFQIHYLQPVAQNGKYPNKCIVLMHFVHMYYLCWNDHLDFHCHAVCKRMDTHVDGCRFLSRLQKSKPSLGRTR